MAKVPKRKSFYIYATSPEKQRVEVVLFPADKYKSLLQGDSILDGFNQAFPKYPKLEVCTIFAICQGKREE